jgi:predicted deacylase
MRISLIVLVLLVLTMAVAAAAAPEQFLLLPGTPYATEVYVSRGAAPGPAALVMGGVHGNEPAGALAAEQVRGFAVSTGTLVVIPRVNKLALAAGIRTLPEIGDINRAYPGRESGTPAERIAAAVEALIGEYRVSLLVDLHEARTFHRLDHTSLGQMILFAANDRSAELALAAIDHINGLIAEPVKKFDFGAHPIPGSAAYHAGTALGLAAFTVETSGKQPIEARAAQHVAIVRSLLRQEGVDAQ